MRRQALVARQAESGWGRLERVHHTLADSPRRHVDHPSQAHVIALVDEDLQVGQRVLDFLPLVEPDAADDAVGDPLAPQRVFNNARLGVGPIEAVSYTHLTLPTN